MKLSDKFILALFGLYFILKPFYFWESGVPQISDYILITAIAFYILINRFRLCFPEKSRGFILVSLNFAFYVSFVNTLWSLILNGELPFINVSVFYIFNFLASVIIVSLRTNYDGRIYKIIYYSVSISILIQFSIFLANGGFSGSRATASFNNPNQLGYHSILSLAILLFLSDKDGDFNIWLIAGGGAALILCLTSLSKAAIISFIGMLLYYILSNIKKRIPAMKINKTYLVLCLLIITVLVVYMSGDNRPSSSNLYNSVKHRLSTIGRSNDDNLSLRGYDRLTKYPQYLIFGAGEGVYSRFGLHMEFHSTLGNILMSYGLVGIFLYIAILYTAYKRNRWKGLYLLVFITLYGLTHNGIRNTLFWILVALVYSKNNDSESLKLSQIREAG